MAQGWTTLVAATLSLFALFTATATAQQPIEGLGAQTRLTAMGPDGNPFFGATTPAVAYNPDRDEFFVVFGGRTPDFPDEQEIYGIVLNGGGGLESGPVRLTNVSGNAAVGSANTPDVIYAGTGATKRYVVSYAATESTAPAQNEVFGITVDATGSAASPPVQITTHTNPATSKFGASLVYDSTNDQVRFVWIGTTSTDPEFEVRTERREADLSGSFAEITVSEMGGALGGAQNAAAIFLPAPINQYLFVWDGDLNGSDGQFEIYAERQTVGSVETVEQRALTAHPGADADALDPSVAYDAVRQRVMIAYMKQDPTLDGSEIFVRRFNAGLDAFAAEQRASTMGPPGATNFTAAEPSVTFLGGPDRYLVTWRGDNDFPGLVDNGIQRWGQAFDAEGTELATDDFRLSSAGPDGNPLEDLVGAGAVEAAHPPTGRWLALYSADDGRPPLADNEFELYGRSIGENFDRDGDGSLVPADCNDGNAGIRPGAADVADNGVDEDCSGADTLDLDRDRDGSRRPADCNDANPAIRARQAGHPEQQRRRGLLGLSAAGCSPAPRSSGSSRCSGASPRSRSCA